MGEGVLLEKGLLEKAATIKRFVKSKELGFQKIKTSFLKIE